MKNLKKLSRNELKGLNGGGPFQPTNDVGVTTCWVHEKNGTLSGSPSDYDKAEEENVRLLPQDIIVRHLLQWEAVNLEDNAAKIFSSIY